jgi:pyridoxine kinase
MQDSSAHSVISISSQVMRGSVGNRAAVFALETLGNPVWSVPTIVMPWHPGHGPSTRLRFDDAAFAAAMDDLSKARWRGEVKGILTGYFGSAAQVHAVAELIQSLRADDPDLIFVCDPVIGDNGGLYVAKEVAEAIQQQLIPLATIATPNRYELGWMVGRELATNNDIMAGAIELGPRQMMVTSAEPMMAGGTGNLYIDQKSALLAEHRAIENAPNGLGDLFAALTLARMLQGHGAEKVLQLATASVFEILARTMKRGANELTLETDASSLATPMAMAMVQLRHLMHPSRKQKN